ncbi:unnamed protein product [Peniophora sp. CBMAI 1063]|nr:unnamed protein product [Peniophora sp. CBMAI 1063]
MALHDLSPYATDTPNSRYTATSYIVQIRPRPPVPSPNLTRIPANPDLRVDEIGSPTPHTRPSEEDNWMAHAKNPNERPELNTTPAPSPRRRPLPSVPRNVSVASNLSSSHNLSTTDPTSPEPEVLPKYPSLPPAYSALPLEKKADLYDAPVHSASSVTTSFTTSPPTSSALSISSSPPAPRSWPTSPARMPATPPRSVPASPSLVPPSLTALAIPPSPSPRVVSGESLSALWSAEVQPSAVDPHRQSFTQALSRTDPSSSTRPSASVVVAHQPMRSVTTPNVRRSDTAQMPTSSGSALGLDGHIKTARRSASAHHLKQRSNAEMYNFPRAGNSFLTLVSPDSAAPVERPRTPSLKQDMERLTRKRERGRPRANVDVEVWLKQTAAQSTRLVGEPATPHPARSPPAALPVPRDPPHSRERSASRSAHGRSAHGPSAFRPPQTPLPAAPSAHSSQAERPHTSHQRAHTLADVPRQRFRSEPDLLSTMKPKHTRSTSERLLMTERPPLPSSPPLRRDSLVPPSRPTTPKLFRSLTSKAKQAFSGRSRVNSNADVPPTPPLPTHTISIS